MSQKTGISSEEKASTKTIKEPMLLRSIFVCSCGKLHEFKLYFEKEYFNEILKIEGDKGPRELLDNNIKDLYRYYIDPNQLFEIDTKEDLYKL